MKEVSEKIKNLRTDNKKTLKQLSDDTGLSVSFLSQVERGESSLAITSLNKIAEALGVHITSFFTPQYTEAFKISPDAMEPFTLEHSDQEFLRASSEFKDRKLDNYIITVYPGNKSESSSHEGEEMYYVLEGEITFYLNQKEYNLKKGEVIHYPSSINHYYINSGGEAARLFCVLTPKLF
ncbi:helix-turn-helix domain-containing protein [Salinicoccus carnicancri]|uniref:helix-turn-helix domain-containing protein n=1 Tax=Salinicoccus carnicancri TaxID=558170 RepID=UPI0002E73BE7|nr:XRE family transcriptional regulator [Salinicoccus carnicancri]